MSRIKDFPGGYSPGASPTAPTKYYGPTEYQVVRLHVNEPAVHPVQDAAGQHPPDGVLGHRPAVPAPARRADRRRATSDGAAPGAAAPVDRVVQPARWNRSTDSASSAGTPTAGSSSRAPSSRRPGRRAAGPHPALPDRRGVRRRRGHRAAPPFRTRLGRACCPGSPSPARRSTDWSSTTAHRLAAGLLGTSDDPALPGAWSAPSTPTAPRLRTAAPCRLRQPHPGRPRHDAGYQQLELFLYLSDVDRGHGGHPHGVAPVTRDIPVERTYLSFDEYARAVRGRGARRRARRIGARLPARHLPPGHVLPRQRARPASCSTSPSSAPAPTGSASRPGPGRPRGWPGTGSCRQPACGS